MTFSGYYFFTDTNASDLSSFAFNELALLIPLGEDLQGAG
jgi:hypothetical protein